MPVSRPTFALGQPDLQLDFPADQQERRQLPNGTEYFGASGTITNIGGEAQSVPPILIVLRDARDRIVYSWEVAAAQAQPGAGRERHGQRGGDRRAALGQVRRDRLEARLTERYWNSTSTCLPRRVTAARARRRPLPARGLAHDRRRQDRRALTLAPRASTHPARRARRRGPGAAAAAASTKSGGRAHRNGCRLVHHVRNRPATSVPQSDDEACEIDAPGALAGVLTALLRARTYPAGAGSCAPVDYAVVAELVDAQR